MKAEKENVKKEQLLKLKQAQDEVKNAKNAIEAAKQERILAVHPLLRNQMAQEIEEEERLQQKERDRERADRGSLKKKKKKQKVEAPKEEEEELHLCKACEIANETIMRSFKVKSCCHPDPEPEMPGCLVEA